MKHALIIAFFTAVTVLPAAAQDIESKLSGNTAAQGFTVKDNSSVNIFTVRGDGKVGIGTATPTANLHVSGLNGILSTGTYGSGTLSATGAGTRLLWYPKKVAFRVGSVDGTQWDDANIGGFSTAMGYNTTASGDHSTAMGDQTTASGNASTAMGYSTTASGYSSTAMGSATTASGDKSTAMGAGADAIGNYSTAMGLLTTASGERSTAMGYSTTASGDYSTAMGAGADAIGNYSTAMGQGTRASSRASLAMGRYNVGGGTAVSWVDTDPLFEIGNGASSSALSNAMTVLKNGNVGIGTASPNSLLHVSQSSAVAPTIKAYNGDINGDIMVLQSFGVSALTRFLVQADGKVGVNTASPTEILDVAGNGRFRSVASSTSANELRLTSAGVLTTHTSDRRLKQDIRPIGDALGKVMRLNGVRFRWTNDPTEKENIGFIAQDMASVFPEFVFTNPTDGYMGINYSELTAVLAEAVKQQQALIDSLNRKTEQVAALQRRVEALESLEIRILDVEAELSALKELQYERNASLHRNQAALQAGK